MNRAPTFTWIIYQGFGAYIYSYIWSRQTFFMPKWLRRNIFHKWQLLKQPDENVTQEQGSDFMNQGELHKNDTTAW